MADFAGLLKKTIDAQANPTPQLRARVYERARETVERKLVNANVSEEVAVVQRQALNDAIQTVEEEYIAVETALLAPISTGKTDHLIVDEVLKTPTQSDVTPLDPSKKQAIDTDQSSQPSEAKALPRNDFVGTAEIESEAEKLDNIKNKHSAQFEMQQNVRIILPQHDKVSEHEQNEPQNKLSGENKPSDIASSQHLFVKEKQFSVDGAENAKPENLDAQQQEVHVKAENQAYLNQSSASNAPSGEYDIVSDIFVQAAKRGGRQAKKRHALIVGGSIVALVVVIGVGVFGALEFLSNKNNSDIETSTKSDKKTTEQAVPTEKLTQRLLPDGTETNPGPAQPVVAPGEGTSTAPASTGAIASSEAPGEATFYQVRTENEAEKIETGTVRWSLVKEASVNGGPEELAIRGDVSIPNEKLTLRMTLRRNTDPTLAASYLLEFIFIVPDNFEGEAIDSLKELTFKEREQAPGQELSGAVAKKIDDNFFFFAVSDARPFVDGNLKMMRNLGWIRLALTDKTGRIDELTFSKGPTGEKIFNQVIDQWLEQINKLTVYDQKNVKPAQ